MKPSFRAALAGVLLASFAASAADAQTAPRFDRTSTHDIAACRTAADQPVCILRALAHFPTHSAYAVDWRFAGADAVLAELGEGGAAPTADPYAHIPYLSTRLAYGHLDATDAAVAAAIRADRRGAAPQEALAYVRGRIGVEQTTPPDVGPGARCIRFSDIWRAYGSERDRQRRPNMPRPSAALARAAVAACAAENAPVDSVSPHELATRFAQFGDLVAARGVMARDTRQPALVQLETALIVGDLDAALSAASAPQQSIEERYRPRFLRLRADTLDSLIAAGRSDQVAALARVVLDASFSDQQANPMTLGTAIEALVRTGARADSERYVRRLDGAGRDLNSVASFNAAQAAVRGWIALGEPAPALALAETWTPRVRRQQEQSGGCSGARPFCASHGVMEMFVRLGRVEEGWRVAPSGPAWLYLSADFTAGRGLQHLETHLAHASSEGARDHTLTMCADMANPTLAQLSWAEVCARRLLERAGVDVPGQDGAHRRRAAAKAALDVSELAAWLGEGARMQSMLDAALTAFGEAAEAPLEPREREALREAAIFQLERAGRL